MKVIEIGSCWKCPMRESARSLCRARRDKMLITWDIRERPPKKCPLRSRDIVLRLARAKKEA